MYVAGRRLFITNTNLVGYCNDSIQEGDEVHLLAGGRVPFILRKDARNATHERNTFRLIGGANIDGVMLGELWPEDTEASKLETVTLI
jgi:hypothetical protein